MQKAQFNDRVSIKYTGKLENGTPFQIITESDPLIITIGSHEVPPSLEQALVGMSIGEQKLVRLEPDEGYGIRRKDLLQTLNKESFGKKANLQIGTILSLSLEKDGQTHKIPATIVETNQNTIVVDYNHPLAGHNLFYDVTLIAIETAEPNSL
ncbi:MAG: FKBP-type peptidyl-prolyl cis-trans isomerase [Desulfobulbaceae bacterium]|jgi:FKBP-type peptidyl-prolyl cis-trans isomerase 2|nr:FKBP-type peptidyl-prolyl cis-trans isomerase [Desulfobulbaceae bacterium]